MANMYYFIEIGARYWYGRLIISDHVRISSDGPFLAPNRLKFGSKMTFDHTLKLTFTVDWGDFVTWGDFVSLIHFFEVISYCGRNIIF